MLLIAQYLERNQTNIVRKIYMLKYDTVLLKILKEILNNYSKFSASHSYNNT